MATGTELISVQGATLTATGLTNVDLIAFTLPGWTRSRINRTTQGNSAVTTKQAGTLKDYGDLVLVIPKDTGITIPTANQTFVITLPDAGGAWTFWGQVVEVGDVEITTDDQQTEQIAEALTVMLTNRNGSDVETAPAFA